MANMPNGNIITFAAVFPSTTRSELDSRVIRLFDEINAWTRRQKGTTIMKAFLPRMRHVVLKAFRNPPFSREERDFVLWYALEKSLRLTNLDFLPVLKNGDSLGHAVAWLEAGSH